MAGVLRRFWRWVVAGVLRRLLLLLVLVLVLLLLLLLPLLTLLTLRLLPSPTPHQTTLLDQRAEIIHDLELLPDVLGHVAAAHLIDLCLVQLQALPALLGQLALLSAERRSAGGVLPIQRRAVARPGMG